MCAQEEALIDPDFELSIGFEEHEPDQIARNKRSIQRVVHIGFISQPTFYSFIFLKKISPKRLKIKAPGVKGAIPAKVLVSV